MAAPNKKRAVPEEMGYLQMEDNEDLDESSDEDGSDDEEEEDSDNEFLNEEVQVDFEARNPEDSDFHGIRKLLQQLFLKANVNLSELSETIISQNYVGSVIKQADLSDMDDDDDDDDDDDGDVFGIITAVNITERKDLESVKQIKAFLLDKCEKCSKESHQKLSGLLKDENQQVGLLLSERFINIPPQISVPSYESLWKEVERAKLRKMPYHFHYYIMITKTYQLPGDKKSQKHEVEKSFINREEECFLKASALSFDYSVKEEHDMVVAGDWDEDETEFEPMRTVLVIPASNIPDIMANVKTMLLADG